MVCTSLISFDKYRCFDIKCHTIWIRILENIREELQTCILLCTTVGGSSCITALCSFLSYFVYHLLSYLREISLTETTISIDLDFFFFKVFNHMLILICESCYRGILIFYFYLSTSFLLCYCIGVKNKKSKTKSKNETKNKIKNKKQKQKQKQEQKLKLKQTKKQKANKQNRHKYIIFRYK